MAGYVLINRNVLGACTVSRNPAPFQSRACPSGVLHADPLLAGHWRNGLRYAPPRPALPLCAPPG